MTPRALTLRTRLLLLILTPLLVIAVLAGFWRHQAARQTALEVFDRNLIALTLVVARDIKSSGGDALSPQTRDLLQTASGGLVYYHISGPDRAFMTGYAYPPRAPFRTAPEEGLPRLFDATLKGEPIRAAQLTEPINSDGLSGIATVTVWQTTDERTGFARRLGAPAALIMLALIGAALLVVWFGVRLGLRPLEDLEDAIAKRHSGDLGAIRRPVPEELQAVVATLNQLFAQVQESLAARDRFISDAAHQLRNPIAGIRAMADSIRSAPDQETALQRAKGVAAAAAHASHLTDQLLRLERLKAGPETDFTLLDLGGIAEQAARNAAPAVLDAGLAFSFEPFGAPLRITGDAVMIGEAVENLIDNALRHGGPEMTRITVSCATDPDGAHITVADDGRGVPPDAKTRIFERFAQIDESDGSGLGLSIVREIMRRHGGRALVSPGPEQRGAVFTLIFPTVERLLKA